MRLSCPRTAHGMVQLGEADDGALSLRSIQPRQQQLHGSLVPAPSERSRGTHIVASTINCSRRTEHLQQSAPASPATPSTQRGQREGPCPEDVGELAVMVPATPLADVDGRCYSHSTAQPPRRPPVLRAAGSSPHPSPGELRCPRSLYLPRPTLTSPAAPRRGDHSGRTSRGCARSPWCW